MKTLWTVTCNESLNSCLKLKAWNVKLFHYNSIWFYRTSYFQALCACQVSKHSIIIITVFVSFCAWGLYIPTHINFYLLFPIISRSAWFSDASLPSLLVKQSCQTSVYAYSILQQSFELIKKLYTGKMFGHDNLFLSFICFSL